MSFLYGIPHSYRNPDFWGKFLFFLPFSSFSRSYSNFFYAFLIFCYFIPSFFFLCPTSVHIFFSLFRASSPRSPLFLRLLFFIRPSRLRFVVISVFLFTPALTYLQVVLNPLHPFRSPSPHHSSSQQPSSLRINLKLEFPAKILFYKKSISLHYRGKWKSSSHPLMQREERQKKTVALEVRQKNDISIRRSEGSPLQLLLCLQHDHWVTVRPVRGHLTLKMNITFSIRNQTLNIFLFNNFFEKSSIL